MQCPKRRQYKYTNPIYRYKTILGGNMRGRGMEGQRIEVQLGCKILNQMALFGMPDSYKLP